MCLAPHSTHHFPRPTHPASHLRPSPTELPVLELGPQELESPGEYLAEIYS